MDIELSSLEQHLSKLIDAYQSLQTENQALRLKITVLQEENARYAEKLGSAKTQVEHILAKLPKEEK